MEETQEITPPDPPAETQSQLETPAESVAAAIGVPLRMPEGPSELSVDGIVYKINADGIVYVPPDVVALLTESFGAVFPDAK